MNMLYRFTLSDLAPQNFECAHLVNRNNQQIIKQRACIKANVGEFNHLKQGVLFDAYTLVAYQYR